MENTGRKWVTEKRKGKKAPSGSYLTFAGGVGHNGADKGGENLTGKRHLGAPRWLKAPFWVTGHGRKSTRL